MATREDFDRNVRVLQYADSEQITGRLVGILKWMESQPNLVPKLTALRELKMGDRLSRARMQTSRNEATDLKAHTKDQIAAVGYELIWICSEQPDIKLSKLFLACKQFPHMGDDNVVVDYAVRSFIRPFLDEMRSTIIEDSVQNGPSAFIEFPVPHEIQHSLHRFRKEHTDKAKVGFLIMRFTKTPAHDLIHQTIREAVEPFGITVLRADHKDYHEDVLWNIRTYMHGCSFGIAVFERIKTNEFNPNVSLEVGYLMAMQCPLILLKDETLPEMPADLVGRIYEPFDFQDPVGSIPPRLLKWLRNRGIIVSP